MKFFMLINLKLLTIAISYLLNLAEQENFSANKYENANYFQLLLAFSYLLAEKISCSAEWSMKKKFYNLGPDLPKHQNNERSGTSSFCIVGALYLV